MGSKEFLEKSKQVVVDYFNSHVDKTDQKQITGDDVFVVWYCKTLQNHKALLTMMSGVFSGGRVRRSIDSGGIIYYG